MDAVTGKDTTGFAYSWRLGGIGAIQAFDLGSNPTASGVISNMSAYYRALQELAESEIKKFEYKGYEIAIDGSGMRPKKQKFIATVNGQVQGMSHTALRAEMMARQYVDNIVFNARTPTRL